MSDSARSPLAGCLILIAAVGILVALIGYSIWVPFQQADEIEKFTQAKPQPVPSPNLEEHEAAARDLVSRLETFRSDLSDETLETRVRLSAADLNLAISLFEPLQELRGAFHVREIDKDRLIIDICYQLNGRPRLAKEGEDGPITADPRYLLGTLHATPRLSKREFALEVEDLRVEDASIPDGFMGHFSTLRLFESAKEDPAVARPMAKLTHAEIDEDQLVLARVPGAPVPETISDESFSAAGGKVALFLGGAMLVFLAIAGLVLFIGYKAQLKKVAAESADSESHEPSHE